MAILLTLKARHPDAGLLPQDQAVRAQALRWLLFVATEIYPMVEINDYPERFAPTPNVAPGVREVARDVRVGRSSSQKSPATRIYRRPGFASRTSTSPSSAAGHSKRHGGQTIFAKWKR